MLDQKLLSKSQVLRMKKVPGTTHNKKIYDLINDNINSSEKASNSVSQFCTPYRGEKTEKLPNWGKQPRIRACCRLWKE
jgi:hypothetical protein